MNIIVCENCKEENEYGIKFCKNCGNELYYQEDNSYEEEILSEEDNSGINVNLTVDEAVEKIKTANLGMSFSIVEKKTVDFLEGKKCAVIVGQKYFYRVENYVSVTIIIHNAGKYTNIEIITTAGGEGLWGIDWGAEGKFYEQIENIFDEHLI